MRTLRARGPQWHATTACVDSLAATALRDDRIRELTAPVTREWDNAAVTSAAEVEDMGVEDLDDDELLARTPSCPAAFGVFYRRHERPVLAYLRHRCGDAELAADLAAETFAAALIGAARYRGGGEPAAAWLFGIARNKLLHARRRGAVEDRARRRLGMEPLVLDDELLARVDRLAGGEWAIELLAGLPAQQARAIRARVIEERSYEQIATAMRCSPSVIRKRVSRGLAAMRAAAKEPR